MKRVLAASVGVLALTAALGTVAGAADLSRGYPAPVRAPYFSPVYNWTGSISASTAAAAGAARPGPASIPSTSPAA